MNGLPGQGGTCPGATTGQHGCLSIRENRTTITCYVDKLKRIYPNKGKSLVSNTELVIEKSYDDLVKIIRNTILKFLLTGGYKSQYFRIHDSGDFFNEDYAKAWAKIINENPNIQFWVYTRSLLVVPILINCKNLALYLSIDPVNKEDVLKVYNNYKQYNNIGLAMMSDDDFLKSEIKFISCPELIGRVKNDETGACSKCKLCFKYNDSIKLRNVKFNIH